MKRNNKISIYQDLMFFILLFLLLNSCEKKEFDSNSNTTEYLTKYMDYNPTHIYPSSFKPFSGHGSINTDVLSNYKITLEYKGNKISKRNGWFLNSTASGFISNKHFYENIYDTLIYANNKTTILTLSNDENIKSVRAYKKEIFYQNNKISKTIQFYNNFPGEDSIIVNFEYKGNLLVKKEGYLYNKIYFVSNLYYNTNENLDSVVTRKKIYNYNTKEYELDTTCFERYKEVFEDYDNNINSLKKLIVFDETFNRSLSRNNFREYHYYYYSKNNNSTLNGDINKYYNFTYDDNGNINWGK